jgi:HAD superfamily hydrolase (TIGR01509 family)
MDTRGRADVPGRPRLALVREERQRPVPIVPAPLTAVIFDVDGTLVDSERMGHRVAFNDAFARAGLPDRWTAEQYGELLRITGGHRRIAAYFLERGYTPADCVALADELHPVKTALFRQMARNGAIPLRPGVRRLVGSLKRHGVRLFVATTGQREWVEPLLDFHFGRSTFERVVTGGDVAALKPDPEVFRSVIEGAKLQPSGVVAVEDSGNGLRAAHGAGIPCLVVANEYTGSDVAEADLVVSGFGPHAAPLYGGAGPLPHGLVTLETIASLAGRIPPSHLHGSPRRRRRLTWPSRRT